MHKLVTIQPAPGSPIRFLVNARNLLTTPHRALATHYPESQARRIVDRYWLTQGAKMIGEDEPVRDAYERGVVEQ